MIVSVAARFYFLAGCSFLAAARSSLLAYYSCPAVARLFVPDSCSSPAVARFYLPAADSCRFAVRIVGVASFSHLVQAWPSVPPAGRAGPAAHTPEPQ